MSRGKRFEREVVNSLRADNPGAFVQRFTDGVYGQAASVKTPPDVIMVRRDEAHLIECKATKSKSIAFDALSDHQYEHLNDFPQDGWVFVLFYNGMRGKARFEEAYAIHIWMWNYFKNNLDRKSIPIQALRDNPRVHQLLWKGKGLWSTTAITT